MGCVNTNPTGSKARPPAGQVNASTISTSPLIQNPNPCLHPKSKPNPSQPINPSILPLHPSERPQTIWVRPPNQGS